MEGHFLYHQVARDIEKLIASGKLAPGEKLPSVRTQAKTLGVSINTIVQTYSCLEEKGLIYSKEKQGFFVAAQGSAKSPNFLAGQKRVERLDVVDEVQWTLDSLARPGIKNLSAAIPDPTLLPTKAITAALKKFAHHLEDYPHPQGVFSLRQIISKRLGVVAPQSPLDADDIVITAGALEALYITLKTLLRPGDTIAIENPTYYMYFKMIQALDLKVVQIASHPETGMCPDALESALRGHPIKLVLCQPNFANPTGALMPESHRYALLELAAKYNVILVQDDINGELSFDGRRHKALFNEAHLFGVDAIYLSSFSKTFSPAIRLGFVASPHHAATFKQTKSLLSISGPLPVQLAMADYLAHGAPEKWLARVRPILGSRLSEYKQFFKAHFPAGTAHTCPRGGFITWVELPEQYDSRRIFKLALENDLSVSPGPIFSADQSFTNFLRINYASALSGKHLQALKLLSELIKQSTH